MKHYKQVLLLLSILLTNVAMSDESIQTKNKKIVISFYELAFNKHKPVEAAKLYIGPKYIQHHPYAPDGVKAFNTFFDGYYKNHNEARVEIKRVIAEGDLVVLHAHSKSHKIDRGRAVVDIFRIHNGKIIEHWDVNQEIPEKIAHTNSMF